MGENGGESNFEEMGVSFSFKDIVKKVGDAYSDAATKVGKAMFGDPKLNAGRRTALTLGGLTTATAACGPAAAEIGKALEMPTPTAFDESRGKVLRAAVEESAAAYYMRNVDRTDSLAVGEAFQQGKEYAKGNLTGPRTLIVELDGAGNKVMLHYLNTFEAMRIAVADGNVKTETGTDINTWPQRGGPKTGVVYLGDFEQLDALHFKDIKVRTYLFKQGNLDYDQHDSWDAFKAAEASIPGRPPQRALGVTP
jgi:hypothetical protein